MSRRIGLVLIAFAFVVNMLGTTLPTPLYPLYERVYGFAPLTITVIFATYAFGVVIGLLLFGHLSDVVGRRPVLAMGMFLSLASALAFLFARHPFEIYAGRVLSGLSAGTFTGSCTAALIDMADASRRAFATTVAVAANIGGLGCGTLLSGLLAQYAPSPLRLVFGVDVALAILALIAIALAPETVKRTGGFTLRIQRLRVPPEIRATFAQAAVAGVCGFAAAGLFSSVAPSFLAGVLHLPNHALAGSLVAAMMFGSAAGQVAVGRISSRRALVTGCVLLLAGVVSLAFALVVASAVLLFVSAVSAGIGQGLAIGAGLTEINARITERRGEVSSAYFVVLYIGLAVPVIGIGLLATVGSIASAGLIFCAIAAVALVTVLAWNVLTLPQYRAQRAKG